MMTLGRLPKLGKMNFILLGRVDSSDEHMNSLQYTRCAGVWGIMYVHRIVSNFSGTLRGIYVRLTHSLFPAYVDFTLLCYVACAWQ